MTKPNKFTGLKTAIQERRSETDTKPDAPPEQLPILDESGQGDANPSQPKRSRGRPKGGKRNNPAFQQVTLYMPSTIYVAVQNELRIRRKKRDYQGPRDMSELVGTLVQAWHKRTLDVESL